MRLKYVLWFMLVGAILLTQSVLFIPIVVADIVDRGIFERGVHPAESVVCRWFNKVFGALGARIDRILETKSGDKIP
jgi:hypothetical protein